MHRPVRPRVVAALAAAVGLGACHGGPNGSPGGGAGSGEGGAGPEAWVGPCVTAIERAAAAPDWKRARIVVDGCRPCGVAWDDVTAARVPAPSRVVGVVDACRIGCPRTARSDFYAKISALEEGDSPRAAWQALGKACPAALGAADPDGRFAGGAWFALDQIGRRLGEARPHLAPAVRDQVTHALGLALPLPAVSVVGTGYDVPGGSGGPSPAVAIAVTASSATVGALPVAHLGPHCLEVPAGWAWPGEPAPPEALARAVAAHGAGPVAIEAPAGLTAARVLEVAGALGKGQQASLAVSAPRDEALFPHVLRQGPVPLRAATGAAHLAITARGDAIAALDGHGAVTAAADLPGPDPAGRLHAVADLLGAAPVVAIAPGDATATDLAATLDALAQVHAGIVVEPAPATAWPTRGPLAAVRTARGEAGSP